MLFLLLSLMVILLSSLLLTVDKRRRRRRSKLPPGPKGWPLLGNLLQLGPNPHETLHALSKTHGPLLHLRFGSVDIIVANSAAVAAKILRHDADFSDRPSSSGTKHMAYNHQDLVFAHHGPRWRMLRKLCAQRLFSSKAMEDLRPVRADEVARLVRELAERGTRSASVVDLGSEISACATNVMSRVVVGRRLFGDGDEGAKEFKDMVEELMNLAGAFNIGDFIPWLAWLDLQGLVAKMKKLHRRFDGFLDRIIAEHRAEKASGGGGGRCDFLSVLIEAKEGAREGEHIVLTDSDIKPLLQNMFAAGTDTTSNTVEMAMAELIRHPGLLARAQHELDGVVGRGRLVSEADLPNLPFLHAVVKETFRHHPAAPLSLPRSASADGEIDGYLIPKGATLLINIWAIARDPAAWPDDVDDPLAFRPDSFLAGGPHHGLDVKGGDFGLMPFGAGRRICAGMNLGLRMVHFMTAALVHAFEWELPEGEVAAELDMGSSFGLTLHKTHPLMARPVPRLLPEAYLLS